MSFQERRYYFYNGKVWGFGQTEENRWILSCYDSYNNDPDFPVSQILFDFENLLFRGSNFINNPKFNEKCGGRITLSFQTGHDLLIFLMELVTHGKEITGHQGKKFYG